MLPLVPILDLGKQPLADKFKTFPAQEEETYPLRVIYCPNCHLVQLKDDVDEDQLWNDEYAFFTGASPSSIRYFEQYAYNVMNRFPDQCRGLVVEIASNDGTFLKHFIKSGYSVMGIEPTNNTARVAEQAGVTTLVKLFSLKTAKEVVATVGQSSLIIGTNVLAHTPNPNDFVQGVKELLTADGVAIFEVQYFPHLIFNNAFDHVYHEHRSFFSLNPLIKLFAQNGLKIFDVHEADTQGGSIRIFVTKKKMRVLPSVALMLEKERKMGMFNKTLYEGMQYRVDYTKQILLDKLSELRNAGKRVHGFGASAKGNTILNYCGIGTELIDCIEDKTPFKIGKYSPGMTIPVVEQGKAQTPDYYLVLVWNYLPGILEREKEFMRKGGHFLVPIPSPMII
jgi:SAM-dependent methyltransferase